MGILLLSKQGLSKKWWSLSFRDPVWGRTKKKVGNWNRCIGQEQTLSVLLKDKEETTTFQMWKK